MRRHYEINNKLLKGLLFDNLKIIALLIIVLPSYWKWRDGTEFILDQQKFIIFSVIILIMNIPSLLIFLNYYFENKNTSFTLDFDTKKIEITQNGTTKLYTINDVAESNYHLGIYYKNAIDRAGRIPMLISDFGYWDLKFKNGDRYYLTNILHDFIHDTPFLGKTKYRFRMFTYINKSDTEKGIKLKPIKHKQKSRIEKLRIRLSEKSEYELNEIINSNGEYTQEAINVAKELIKKNVG